MSKWKCKTNVLDSDVDDVRIPPGAGLQFVVTNLDVECAQDALRLLFESREFIRSLLLSKQDLCLKSLSAYWHTI